MSHLTMTNKMGRVFSLQQFHLNRKIREIAKVFYCIAFDQNNLRKKCEQHFVKIVVQE